MNLAGELRAWFRPGPFENRLQILVLAPVLGYVVVDLPGHLVKDGLGICILPDWPVDGLPDVELFAAAAIISERQFVAIDLLRGDKSVALVVAHGGLCYSCVCSFDEEGVLAELAVRIVEINVGVGMEVDGVGAGGESSIVVIGVEDLHGERLPAAG